MNEDVATEGTVQWEGEHNTGTLPGNDMTLHVKPSDREAAKVGGELPEQNMGSDALESEPKNNEGQDGTTVTVSEATVEETLETGVTPEAPSVENEGQEVNGQEQPKEKTFTEKITDAIRSPFKKKEEKPVETPKVEAKIEGVEVSSNAPKGNNKGNMLKTAYLKAYGDEVGAKLYDEMIDKAKKVVENVAQKEQKPKTEEKPKEPKVEIKEPLTVELNTAVEMPKDLSAQLRPLGQEAPVQEAPEQLKEPKVEIKEPLTVELNTAVEMPKDLSAQLRPLGQEAPEQEAPEQPKEPIQQSGAKDKYPSLFSLFSGIMNGGNEGDNKKDDEILTEMFALAFAAMMGVDVFKERLDERERQLQEELEKERQARLAAEQALESEKSAKVAEPPAMEIKKVNEQDIPSLDGKLNVEAKVEVPKTIKTPAEMAFDKMSGGKEQVTLADLEKAGVNLKTDLQPVLKSLAKDNPAKVGELAPQGLGDKDKPVSKEFAVALIARKQQRDTMMHNNMNMRA